MVKIKIYKFDCHGINAPAYSCNQPETIDKTGMGMHFPEIADMMMPDMAERIRNLRASGASFRFIAGCC